MTTLSLGGMGVPHGSYQPNTSVLIRILNSNGCKTLIDSNGEFYLAFDHEEESYDRFIEYGGKAGKAILIRQETDAVYPGQYRKRVEQKYGLVLTLGGAVEIQKHGFLGHPYMPSSNPTSPTELDSRFLEVLESAKSNALFEITNWRSRKIDISFVGANKVGLNPKGNYGIRRKLVKELAPLGLEVYGILWNDGLGRRFINRILMIQWGLKTRQRPPFFSIFADIFQKYENAMGTVENKQTILRDSKFSLIVENSDSIMTEKLFDAILAGSIPIFYGARLSQFGFPEGLAVEVKNCEVPIGEVILSMTDEEVARRLGILREFLESEAFQNNWLAESVYLKVWTMIEKFMRSAKL